MQLNNYCKMSGRIHLKFEKATYISALKYPSRHVVDDSRLYIDYLPLNNFAHLPDHSSLPSPFQAFQAQGSPLRCYGPACDIICGCRSWQSTLSHPPVPIRKEVSMAGDSLASLRRVRQVRWCDILFVSSFIQPIAFHSILCL